MLIESNGRAVSITAAEGWELDGNTVTLSLHEARALRDALHAMHLTFGVEGVGENGEDG